MKTITVKDLRDKLEGIANETRIFIMAQVDGYDMQMQCNNIAYKQIPYLRDKEEALFIEFYNH